MEFKGTKGGWLIKKHYCLETKDNQVGVIGLNWDGEKNTRVVCLISPIEHFDNEDEANAKLIASSPDLLEALQYLKSQINLTILPESVEEKINKAIEKALK